ncbi:murein hydrolase activator EnvC family protein [Moorella sp. Hama-1]|uniref:murein hydrolase activator EnvC family protein n=1 Tax=Moorella sp. Hama-1 TaxID=2138101 RepID=UPI000D64E66E|nr:peptidoglycan DD-metalloendopeptidase family protein [Moorella sp. Hama-1]MDN5361740.1 hypothetical protein [Moorella sp. (in: firmicutes)]BCV20167.1 peptidase M23 [Moorella sp. Hama-1]
MHRRVITLILLLAFTLGLLPAYGASLDELQKQQQQVQQNMEQQQKLLQQKNDEGAALMQQLQQIEQEIQQKQAQIASLDQQMATAQGRVQQATAELQQAEADQAKRMEILRARLKDIYQVGQVNYLEVLLQSTSLEDFLVRMELLANIARGDINLINEIKAERDKIAARKSELEAERNRIAELRRQADGERVQLASRQASQRQLLAQVEQEKKRVAAALDEMEATARQIAAKIRAEQAKSNRKLAPEGVRGMLWPLPGYTSISSPFGWRVHPLLKTRRFHDGVDLPAPEGTEIIAPLDGQVISTGYIGGYGNHIVIDHGGGLSTMYGHLSAILVSNGQEVKKGQVIGRVGSTGWSTGPHLHFMVLLQGEPTNPMNYY